MYRERTDSIKSVDWPCPKCSSKGSSNLIKLKQINSSEALYICEGKQCLYPLEALKKLPIIKREIETMPVTKELLEKLNLPISLLNEPEVNESHLFELLELNSLNTHFEKIQETKKAWESFVTRMTAHGEDIPSEYLSYKDADLAKLENFQSSSNNLVRHILIKSESDGNSSLESDQINS